MLNRTPAASGSFAFSAFTALLMLTGCSGRDSDMAEKLARAEAAANRAEAAASRAEASAKRANVTPAFAPEEHPTDVPSEEPTEQPQPPM